MNIYYFNPDNDLALANGGDHYTPTPMAEQLRRDLQLLPCWIADEGDCVLCDSSKFQPWIHNHGLNITIITPDDLPKLDGNVVIRPWGWSPAMRWRLLRYGVKESLLPTTSQIKQWRQLSHRRTTIALHEAISRYAHKSFCPAPIELTDLHAILKFAHDYPGCYAKEPWSGSGRGVYRALDPDGQDFIQRCKGALNRQGSMLCERPFERIMDFAIEMRCENGKSHITGYSIFNSDFHLQYKGGIVGPKQKLRNAITSQFAEFQHIEDAVVKAIDEVIAGYYNGDLGVDMLLFANTDGSIGINPCVELNLRTTMGTVTASLGEQHEFNGIFSIIPYGDLKDDDIPLTPVVSNTKMVAIVRK